MKPEIPPDLIKAIQASTDLELVRLQFEARAFGDEMTLRLALDELARREKHKDDNNTPSLS